MEDQAYGKDNWLSLVEKFNHVKGTYLDHAGATLYNTTQLERVFSELSKNCFGNPHSRSPSSRLTTDLIDQTRAEILNFFNTNSEEYYLIFTSGATNSMKIVAECFEFSSSTSSTVSNEQLSSNSSFVYIKESHTSVVGMREYIKSFVPCFALPSKEIEYYLHDAEKKISLTSDISCTSESETTNTSNSLFVFPAQCNFSGYKYPLQLIKASKNGLFTSLNPELCINIEKLKNCDDQMNSNWYCLLDAASFAATSPLDLSLYKPDMVAVSFYKIFGYPTGLGALIVNRRATNTLKKKYFGGGTVEMFSSSRDFHVSRQLLHEKFEDGTMNFLAILSLRHGLNELKKLTISMESVSIHTFHLGQYVYNSLLALKHANGRNLVEIYSSTDFTDRQRQGAIVTFNLIDEYDAYIGYAQVEKILALYDIHVRTGCFCNPAACQQHLHLTEEDTLSQFLSGHKCGDENDLINGRPTGAVRVSFGYMSKKSDAIHFIEIIRNCFLQGEIISTNNSKGTLNWSTESTPSAQLVGIHIYPIKSCGAFSPKIWRITKSGLLYDRKWVIVNAAGAALTQKREPRLCLIIPEIDLTNQLLHLRYRDSLVSTISIPLELNQHNDSSSNEITSFTKICGKLMKVTDCGSEVSLWLSEALQQSGLKLLRYDHDSSGEKTSLANDSPFLLINRNSVVSLQKHFTSASPDSEDNFVSRFRGNFVIDGVQAFEEEHWESISLGPFTFKNVGACHRCQMICIDQETAVRNQEPLIALSNSRGKKVQFGILLELATYSPDEKETLVEVGMQCHQ